jgi:signal transduction histidine kinase
MRTWFHSMRGGLIGILAVSSLVAGGLGWATVAALRLEREQYENQSRTEIQDKTRLALWRMDSLIAPILARENGRPYNHFSAIYPSVTAFRKDGRDWPAGTVLEASPLLSAQLPPWILFHFQVAADTGWVSPQVLNREIVTWLEKSATPRSFPNRTPERAIAFAEVTRTVTPDLVLASALQAGGGANLEDTTLVAAANLGQEKGQRLVGQPGAQKQLPRGMEEDFASRFEQQQQLRSQNQAVTQRADPDNEVPSLLTNGTNWLMGSDNALRSSRPIEVSLGQMVPIWLKGSDGVEHLVVARRVQVGKRELCQGMVLDTQSLETALVDEVKTIFPRAAVRPSHSAYASPPDRVMAALPLELEPGEDPAGVAIPPWTPLRIGLVLAWVAALAALTAVGLGGWALLDLADRRIRFVSAVTHELRTPLTTLRLYLDMLTGGMVKEEPRKEEYLHTLNAEAERLNRLVSNVLDFSRLENRASRMTRSSVRIADLVDQLVAAWHEHCRQCAKELIVETDTDTVATVFTDSSVVQQILGNLIDNACKYSREAADPYIRLRVRNAASGRVAFQVDDAGPGIAAGEERLIFRPFRRGKKVDAVAGGAGLGLALAYQWATLLGGTLRLGQPSQGKGACFVLELPAVAP